MKDFQAARDINIEGGVTIHNSPTYEVVAKPFWALNNQELYQEADHREGLLKDEKKIRERHIPKLFIIGGVLCAFTVIGQKFFADLINPIAFFFTAMGTIGSIYFAAQMESSKSEFEVRQIEALKEIRTILKERRAEKK